MDAVSAGYRNIDETRRPCPKIIVSGINFSLQAGQRIGLLGINGAGKSTFIKTIAGELQSLAGTPSSTRACPSATSPSTRSRCCATMNRRCGT